LPKRQAPGVTPDGDGDDGAGASNQDLLGRRFAPEERMSGKRNAQKVRDSFVTSNSTSTSEAAR
jgi:hypothetical protein